ncbi:MAG TPA: RICIN domain-containing protein [Micromonosporaceae bacterium]|nr:RICIN domain-containing protein [Micromonosporaceae bacterium]
MTLSVVATVALAGGLLPVIRAGQAEAATVSFTSTVLNSGSGICMDVPGGSAASGTQLVQWSCNSGANQSFRFNAVPGTDVHTIGTAAAGNCVDIFGASSADNAAVIQYACHSGTNQQVRLRLVSGTGAGRAFNIVSVQSGKCFAPLGDASANNTPLVQLPCTAAASRTWRLAGYTDGGTTPTPAPTPTSTGGSGDVWNPPARYLDPLARNWKHQEDTYQNLYGFRNYLFDQVMAGNGNINYCVRWDSRETVSASLRDQIHANLARQFQKWVDQLNDNGQGWNNFPYQRVAVKVVGWAVRDRNQLQWTDNSVDVYVNNIRENAPQCGEPCGRFFNQDGNYSGCPGGAAHHYDMSLWLTAGFSGGHGGDWGQRIASEYYVGQLGQEDIHILLHEIGHSWGLNDFYTYDPLPSEGFVMKAGSATRITEFDKWMLRDFWRHLKGRYGR